VTNRLNKTKMWEDKEHIWEPLPNPIEPSYHPDKLGLHKCRVIRLERPIGLVIVPVIIRCLWVITIL